MSHIKKAKEIMAKVNKTREEAMNRTKDPRAFHKKKELVEEQDESIKQRVEEKNLTEKDRFKIMNSLRQVHNKRGEELRKNLKKFKHKKKNKKSNDEKK